MQMPAQHELMRSTNALSVLEHIRKHGESTRRDIQLSTGLSWAAVSTICSELLSRQVLKENAPKETRAGKNPSYLVLNPERNLTIGLELNIRGITALLVDLRCNVLDRQAEDINSIECDQIINQIICVVDQLLNRNAITKESLLGIGIALQGSINKKGSISLYNAFFKDWRNIPLKNLFEQRFGIETHIIHDPVSIALEQQWENSYGADDDFALIRLSYGIGMCYIANKKPIIGYSGTAGELGHMVVNREGPICSCGNHGCLESYCSIRGLSSQLYEAARSGCIVIPKHLLGADKSRPEIMLELVAWAANEAHNGNQNVQTIFDEMGYYLGIGLANVVSLFNPKRIILTGDLLSHKDLFLHQAQLSASQHAWEFSHFELCLLDQGQESAAKGAALYFVNNAFDIDNSPLLAKQ